MAIRIINRVIALDIVRKKILLVKNRNANFWYPPGGEWEDEKETLIEGSVREVLEEAGVRVRVTRLLYVRTFQPQGQHSQLELIWLARPQSTRLRQEHRDQHGLVETARWFSKRDLQKMSVFPECLKNHFWKDTMEKNYNPYLKG